MFPMVFGMILEWKLGLGSVLLRGRSVSLWNKFLWLYLARQRLETEVKGQGLCMLATLMGHFHIFWLESLYVHYLSYLLSKTPPSFFCCWMPVVSDISRESILCDSRVR